MEVKNLGLHVFPLSLKRGVSVCEEKEGWVGRQWSGAFTELLGRKCPCRKPIRLPSAALNARFLKHFWKKREIGLTYVKLKRCLSNNVLYIFWKYCTFDSTSDYKKSIIRECRRDF